MSPLSTHVTIQERNTTRNVNFQFSYLQNIAMNSIDLSAAAAAAAVKSIQLCPTLCDPIDGSPPSSPVPGILQARTLEWVAISFSKHESEK